MIAQRWIVGIGLACACAIGACKRSTSGPNPSDATASTSPSAVEPADAGGPSQELADDPLPGDAAVNVPSSREERNAALGALVLGSGKANQLPETAMDPGVAFDRSLRKRLTTVEVEVPAEQSKREVVVIGGSTVTVPVTNVDRVIAGLRPRMRACYRMGLNVDPSMAGKLVIGATLTPAGEVASTKVVSSSGISATVGQCVTSILQRAQFDAPGGKGSSLQFSVTFSQDK
ncbi:MAG TPA: AgmX/PglI C-terminal domain-containing protein [Labilithrix sp.]|jgi:hypothetical protein|nr:AgmX/PglI C-terminal domain-containing protein [Labilithrix sp.]